MGEVLFWSAAVFAVLGVPPLLLAWTEWQRERRDTRLHRARKQIAEKPPDAEQSPDPSETASPPLGVWPGILIVTWMA
jgi:hypothetical protein